MPPWGLTIADRDSIIALAADIAAAAELLRADDAMLAPEPLEVEPLPPHARALCGAAKKTTAAIATQFKKMSRAIEASFDVPFGPANSQPTAF